MIDEFEKVVECTYKGEKYSVRDNGALLRHPHIGKKPRPTDNVWTFGKYNDKTGYAEIAGERVHRIVATAFHGEAPSPQYVVDHIDTNRRNNRPENLRWVTKLENILLNPITAKKIVLVCGSIEEFLKDTSILRQNKGEPNFEWMRAVSKEESLISLERMQSWAKSDKCLSGGSLGEWIFQRNLPKKNIESEKTTMATQNETENTDLEVIATIKQETEKTKPARTSKRNPFNFPRSDELDSDSAVVMYRTSSEIVGLIKEHFDLEKKLKLPDIILSTAGKGIVLKNSWIEEFVESEYCCEERARIPKSIVLHCKDGVISLIIRINSSVDEKEINRLKCEGFNIVEIDLSWAKDGITYEEMKYILQSDVTKKKWIQHELIQEARGKLQNVCEPISGSGQGVFHSYFACPLTSNSVDDIDCYYCDYRIESEMRIDGETNVCGLCFGKSGVKTYKDLLSIINVEKEDEKIVGITYNRNGKIIKEKFNKEVQLPGKTLFQLWDEKTGDELIAHNINSDWFVLLEENPKINFDITGKVYGKLGKDVENLRTRTRCSIFSFDSSCWEIVK